MDSRQVAALAGVFSYLAQRQLEAKDRAGGAPSPVPPGPRPWALFGRQAIMSERIRIQRRRRA
jgi:hypothetical protein